MPFALIGFFMGYEDSDKLDWKVLGLIVLCMVFARNAAMAFNRYLDRDIDAGNDRTKGREIPSGMINPKNALIFVIVNSILFIVTSFLANTLCGFLSPVALLVILGYSFTKRFTALCHVVLGIGLGLAPVGAYIALTGKFTHEGEIAWHIILIGVAVLTWVSGFDIIYALQDEEFDRKNQLHSIPSFLGKERALWVSNILHVLTAACLGLAGYLAEGNWLYWAGAGVFALLLIYQHLLVKPNDLSRVNLAFFTTNGIASVVFATFVITDIIFLQA